MELTPKGDFQGKTWRETGNGNVYNGKYVQGLLNVGELIWRQEELDPAPDLRERKRIKCLSLHVALDAIEEETRKDEVEKDEEIARLLGHISLA